MKIKILFIAPPEGIGGGNRKFKIYYDNLDSRFFNKFYYYLNGDNFLIKNNVEGDTSKKISLINFIKENQIQFLYSGSDLDYKTLNEVKGF